MNDLKCLLEIRKKNENREWQIGQPKWALNLEFTDF
jgi:hypothetical protein